MAPNPYKRNGILALFGAILPRKLEMCKFMHFNDFCDFLLFFAFWAQKSKMCKKSNSGTKKTLTNPFVLLAF